MKHLVFLMISFFATAVFAQAPAKEAAKPEPIKAAAKPETPKQAATGPRIPNPRRWHEDARHCLERPTNTEIIKCAEEYL